MDKYKNKGQYGSLKFILSTNYKVALRFQQVTLQMHFEFSVQTSLLIISI